MPEAWRRRRRVRQLTTHMPGAFNDRALLIGASLAQLATTGRAVTIHERPGLESCLFDIRSDGAVSSVLFKYSTRRKSPWYFTVTREQLEALRGRAPDLPPSRRYFALVCHTDGVCLVSLDDFDEIVTVRRQENQWGLSVSRPRSSQYRVSGPGKELLDRAVPRSRWTTAIFET
jgi:hypothetical protein